MSRGLINKDELMTRIRRMRLSVGEREEWISLVPGGEPDTHLAISQDGEEFEFTDNRQESLETQIRRILRKRDEATSD